MLSDGKVVIIDAGSRQGFKFDRKKDFNMKVMKTFWSKAQTYIPPELLLPYKEEWRSADHDLGKCVQHWQIKVQKLRIHKKYTVVLNSLREHNDAIAKCPKVASLLDNLNTDALDWITTKYLWGELRAYGPSADGYLRRQDNYLTAAAKLEQLIAQTYDRRVPYCKNANEDILEEWQLRKIMKQWRKDYRSWMYPESLIKYANSSSGEWREFVRSSLRTHLWRMSGSYEVTVFFIVAPFNDENFVLLRNCEKLARNPTEFLEIAKAEVRRRRR